MTKTLPSSFPRRLLAAATVLAALVLPLRPPPVFAASDPSSLAARIAAAPAGSTVTVDPGSYPQLVLKSLSWSSPVTVTASSPDAVTIAGLQLTDVSNVIFRGLTISDASTVTGGSGVQVLDSHLSASNDSTIGPLNSVLFLHNGVSNAVVAGNVITGGLNGVQVAASCLDATLPCDSWAAAPSAVTVQDNDITGGAADGVHIGNGTNVVVTHNQVHDTLANDLHNDGVQVYGGSQVAITGNKFWNNDQDVIVNASSTNGTVPSGTVVVDNLLVRARGTGIRVANTPGTRIYNNTVWDNVKTPIAVQGANTDLQVWGNVTPGVKVVAGATAPTVNDGNCGVGTAAGPHDVAADPGFADTDDYHLSATSPCINLGSGADPAVDFDGYPRTDGAPDAGAQEYHGVPAPPTGVTAAARNGAALVTWTPPAVVGAGPVSGYTATASPGGQTSSVDGATSSAIVAGLTNGTTYSFTVSAANVVGNSAASGPSQAVTPSLAQTTTGLAASTASTVYGQPVTFTATVTSPESWPGTPTGGTVTFADGANVVGTAPLSDGQATLAGGSLGVGTHNVTASYGGAGDFAPSASTASSETVSRATTSTGLASSLNPSVRGIPVTLTATVSASSPSTMTPSEGSVTFKDGSAVLGTVAVVAGKAQLVTSSLSVGTRSLTASYGGTANLASSASAVLSQVVNKATLTVVAPNGGETWKRGVTQSIRWTYTGAPGTSVKIQLLRWGYVVSTVTTAAPIGAGGGGTFGWIPSNALAAGGGYQVKVLVNAASPAVNDKSNTNFSLS